MSIWSEFFSQRTLVPDVLLVSPSSLTTLQPSFSCPAPAPPRTSSMMLLPSGFQDRTLASLHPEAGNLSSTFQGRSLHSSEWFSSEVTSIDNNQEPKTLELLLQSQKPRFKQWWGLERMGRPCPQPEAAISHITTEPQKGKGAKWRMPAPKDTSNLALYHTDSFSQSQWGNHAGWLDAFQTASLSFWTTDPSLPHFSHLTHPSQSLLVEILIHHSIPRSNTTFFKKSLFLMLNLYDIGVVPF